MEKQNFLVLSYFDEIEPKELNDENLTAQILSFGIGDNEGFKYQYFNIVQWLRDNGFLKELFDDDNTKRIRPAANRKSNGYVLTVPRGINALDCKLPQNSARCFRVNIDVMLTLKIYKKV